MRKQNIYFFIICSIQWSNNGNNPILFIGLTYNSRIYPTFFTEKKGKKNLVHKYDILKEACGQ